MNFLAPFSFGALMNIIENSPHIGCCHTIYSVALGSLYLGIATMIASIPIRYLLILLMDKYYSDWSSLLLISALGYYLQEYAIRWYYDYTYDNSELENSLQDIRDDYITKVNKTINK